MRRVAVAAAPAYESRPARTRTYLSGKLAYGNGAFTLDCVVRDVSETGAKITLAKSQPLPSEVFLIIVKYGVAHLSNVRWSNYPARGLFFSQSHSLTASLPAELRFLRQLWLELCERYGVSPIVDQWAARNWHP